MPKKQPSNPPSSSSISGPQMARMAVYRQYQCLQQAWDRELQNDSTDWPALFRLHYKIAEMEKRAPWLKKESLS